MASGIVELIVGRGPTGVSLRALSHLPLFLSRSHSFRLSVAITFGLVCHVIDRFDHITFDKQRFFFLFKCFGH